MARKSSKRKNPKRVAAGRKAARSRKAKKSRRKGGAGVASLRRQFASIKKKARRDVSNIKHQAKERAEAKKLRGEIRLANALARAARSEAKAKTKSML